MFEQTIARRITTRCEALAHCRFLRKVSEAGLGLPMVIVGSGAMHGAYLQARRTPILDIVVRPLTAVRFAELMRRAEIQICPTRYRNHYTIVGTGGAGQATEIGIRLWPRQADTTPVHEVTLHGPLGHSVRVNAPSLAQLVIDKFHRMSDRLNARDYYDIWSVLKFQPSVADIALSEFELACLSKGTPEFNRSWLLAQTTLLGPGSWKSVEDLAWPIPEIATVRQDLASWFAGTQEHGT